MDPTVKSLISRGWVLETPGYPGRYVLNLTALDKKQIACATVWLMERVAQRYLLNTSDREGSPVWNELPPVYHHGKSENWESEFDQTVY